MRRVAALVAATAVGALAPVFSATPAFATQPVIFQSHVESSFQLSCDTFTVTELFTDDEVALGFFDQEGNFVRFWTDIRLSETFTNDSTGKTLTIRASFHDEEDIDSGLFTTTGARLILTVPGDGIIAQFVGRVVFDFTTGELLFEAGVHEGIPLTLENLCSLLA